MERHPEPVRVYLEIGNKRIFACAVDWPGWCRSGRDEALALQALFDYGSRYAGVLRASGLGFRAPTGATGFTVVERLRGNSTTDFGAPDIAPSNDVRIVDSSELDRFKTLLMACWDTFDAAVSKAEGKKLRLGPRGGGRDLDKIIRHVLEADAAYLSRISRKLAPAESADPDKAMSRTRKAVLNALVADAHSDVPEPGPRGGKRWTLRFFVRRLAWHVLDHAWEIEDRIT